MSKKFRTIYSIMPIELIPLYEKLQDKLNIFLSDKKYREMLLSYNGSLKFAGDRQLIGKALGDPHKEWKDISNSAWYGRMVYENIRQILLSQQESIKICELLSKNNWVYTEEIKNELHNLNIYPTNSQISNLIKSRQLPELVYSKTFVMDYSCSDTQNCLQENKNTFKLKYSDKDWIEYRVPLPTSIRKEATQDMAKPCFVKSREHGYIGLVRYEVKYNKIEHKSNILGVDLGKIKLFSGVVLYKDGSYSQEYVCSRELLKLKSKLEVLYEKKRQLEDKEERILKNNKNDTRSSNVNLIIKSKKRELALIRINEKIIRLKLSIAKLLACEIVEIAKLEKCQEIHMENLSWLESSGGKWNFSEIINCVRNVAELEGIKLILVSARNTSSENPITKELGKKINRIVRFIDGYEIDRDVLAAINIASRNKKQPRHVKELKKKHTATPKRVNRKNNTRKNYIKNLISNFNINKSKDLIVTLAPNLVLNGNRWVVSNKHETITNSCLLRPYVLSKQTALLLSNTCEF